MCSVLKKIQIYQNNLAQSTCEKIISSKYVLLNSFIPVCEVSKWMFLHCGTVQ